MTNATKTKKQTLPKEVTKLYKAILKAQHPWHVIQDSPIFNKQADKLTELLCDWENLDFLVICEQECYLFAKNGLDWEITKTGRPYVLFSDEPIQTELKRKFPEIHWVYVSDNENEKPETFFQSHFRDKLETLIESACFNL